MTGSPNKQFLPPTFELLTHLSPNGRERETQREDEKIIYIFLKRMKLSGLRKWKILLFVVSHAAAGSCFPPAYPRLRVCGVGDRVQTGVALRTQSAVRSGEGLPGACLSPSPCPSPPPPASRSDGEDDPCTSGMAVWQTSPS